MNLGAVSTLIFDLDGVVWRGNSPIEGAVEAIMQLKASGKRCLYCTNNSSQTPAAFVEKLKGVGIEASEDDIITSSTATALYLSAQYTGPFLAYVLGGDGIQTAIQKIGARIVYDRDIDDDTNVDCVIAGIDRTFDYERLNTAQRLIRKGALFVATNRDATYPVEHGVIPGAGAVVAAVETASGVTPVTIGKPRPVMIQLVQQKFRLQPQEIAFIGDRLDTDIVCARRAGVAALLVLTGVTTLAQARRAKGELRPDAVFPDLPSMVSVIIENSPASPLDIEDLPTYVAQGTAVAAEPVTQGAPRGEAESFPVATESPYEARVSFGAPAEPAAAAAPVATAVEEAPVEEVPVFEAPVAAEESAAPAGEEDQSFPAPAFSFDTALSKEEQEAQAAAEAGAVASEAPDGLPAAEGDVNWDDKWFDEAAAGENGGENGVVAENGAHTEEEKPAAAPGGFEWKLD